MKTMRSARNSIGISSLLIVLAAACGSAGPVVTADDTEATTTTTQQQEVTTTGAVEQEMPPDGFTRVTFGFEPPDVIDDVYEGDLTTFEVRSASGSETVVFGFLDDTGTIDIPNDRPGGLAGETLGVEAEWPDDEFCWWSGFVVVSEPGQVIAVTAELEEVCA